MGRLGSAWMYRVPWLFLIAGNFRARFKVCRGARGYFSFRPPHFWGLHNVVCLLFDLLLFNRLHAWENRVWSAEVDTYVSSENLFWKCWVWLRLWIHKYLVNRFWFSIKLTQVWRFELNVTGVQFLRLYHNLRCFQNN